MIKFKWLGMGEQSRVCSADQLGVVSYYLGSTISSSTRHQQVSEGEIASRLDCRPGMPLIVFDEVAYNIKDEPILCFLVYHHHESLRLKVVRSK